MSEAIVLDERFLFTCMNCGGFMQSESPYDFYCCKKCEKEGEAFIAELAEEYVKSFEVEC